MGDTTAISWADHTFNPWEGCTRISPACDHCYAADRAHRFGNDRLWSGELRRTSPSNWRKPLRWDEEAKASGRPRRVFCASLSDVFDNQAPQEWREDLWALIEATPDLTWMLLTKRPQNIIRMVRDRWANPARRPTSVMLGFTAEDQERLNQRGWLVANAARQLGWRPFVSDEPLLGPLDFTRVPIPATQPGQMNLLTGAVAFFPISAGTPPTINVTFDYPPLALLIAGGESGPDARPTNPAWVRDLRDQCAEAAVPFHLKQWGEWLPYGEIDADGDHNSRTRGEAAGLWHEWGPDEGFSVRVGKKQAGRRLDGVEHLAMPQ